MQLIEVDSEREEVEARERERKKTKRQTCDLMDDMQME